MLHYCCFNFPWSFDHYLGSKFNNGGFRFKEFSWGVGVSDFSYETAAGIASTPNLNCHWHIILSHLNTHYQPKADLGKCSSIPIAGDGSHQVLQATVVGDLKSKDYDDIWHAEIRKEGEKRNYKKMGEPGAKIKLSLIFKLPLC